jgi:protein gp37
MARVTPIKWCHSTINPVMGCDGCEIGPQTLSQALIHPKAELVFADYGHPVSSSRHLRELAKALEGTETGKAILKELQKCYACVLTSKRAGKVKGYPKNFFVPELFAGRMEDSAKWPDRPTRPESWEKPWISNMPRMIFISDMGDALSANVPFEYLKDQIIDAVMSPGGVNKIWLWLTKRPGRMADFGHWLMDRNGISWPDQLWAGTTITHNRSLNRAPSLLNVPAKHRFLSCEPLWGYADLTPFLGKDLIDWVIVGGESGGKRRYCTDFQLSDLHSLLDDVRAKGASPFVKQVGRNPVDLQGNPIQLCDGHGGDWDEWSEFAWAKVREVPLP